MLAFAGCAYIGNFVDFEPVDAARVGEDENVGVSRGNEKMLDEVLVARLHAGAPGAAAALHAVGGNRRALEIAAVAGRARARLAGGRGLRLGVRGSASASGVAPLARR